MPTVVFRCGPNADPMHESMVPIVVDVDHFPPLRRWLGKVSRNALGTGGTKRRFRYAIPMDAGGFTYSSGEDGAQDYGRLSLLLEWGLQQEYVYVHRVYAQGTAGVPAPRAMYDPSDLTDTQSLDRFWYATANDTGDGYPVDADRGHVPMRVRQLEDSDEAYDGGGTTRVTVELVSEEVFRVG